MSTAHVLSLLVVVVGAHLASAIDLKGYSASSPLFFAVNANNTEYALNNITTINVTVGDRVIIGCYFGTERAQIVRWHPVRANDYKVLAESGTLSEQFLTYAEQFPTLSSRYEAETRAGATAIIIKNFQPQDGGQFGCLAIDSRRKVRTDLPVLNVTISLKSITYLVNLLNFTQQATLNASDAPTSLKANCSVVHSIGSEPVAYFDLCDYVTGKCEANGNPANSRFQASSKKTITVRQPTQVYGEYWSITPEADFYELSTTIDKTWLNRSLVCFARKYRDGDATIDDRVTFVPPGVDLHLDPSNFECTKNKHVKTRPGQQLTFACTVKEPYYRPRGDVYWQIIYSPSKTLNYRTSEDITKVPNVQSISIRDSTSNDLAALQRNIVAELKLTVDVATTASYKYRVVAQYPVKTYVSDTFDITLDTDVGKMKGGSAGVTYSLSALCAAALLMVLNRN